MKYNISNTTGFYKPINPQPITSERVVNIINNPVAEKNTGFLGFDGKGTEERIQKCVERAEVAYTVDGFVRQAVDKYSENFKDFSFKSDNKLAIKYLEKRLNSMSLKTNEPWKTTLTRIIHEYWRTGNSFFVKVRGPNPSAIRPLYKQQPFPIVGIFILSPSRLEPDTDKETLVFGWKFKTSYRPVNELKLVLDRDNPLPSRLALINNVPKTDPELLIPGQDIVQITYKKLADSNWGFGVSFSSLEDIMLLRSLEQTTAIMVKKNSNPIIHHKVTRSTGANVSIQTDINRAGDLHRMSAPEGVIITGPSHEIKAIGAESQALRVGEYLDYFSKRALAGLGVSPFIMGFESAGTAEAAEAAQSVMRTRVRFCEREIAGALENFLINEILYEGGFDPYNNPKDKVKIVFEEIDQSYLIKLQTHYADLFTKNYVDLSEARLGGGYTDSPQDSLLYVNKVKKEEIKAMAQKNASQVKNSWILDQESIKETIHNLLKDYGENTKKLLLQYIKNVTSSGFEDLLEMERQIVSLGEDTKAIYLYLTEKLFKTDEN
jgi:hypothetical protein